MAGRIIGGNPNKTPETGFTNLSTELNFFTSKHDDFSLEHHSKSEETD